MKSELREELSLLDLQQKSNAAIDDFEQQKEDELVSLLVKFVMKITFNGYEKSDQVSAF